MDITRAQQVAEQLRSHDGGAVCDDCLAETLGARPQLVTTITAALHMGGGEFAKAHGRCAVCEQEKLVTARR